MANQVEQICLSSAASQSQKNEALRMMISWAADPKVCACQRELVKAETTPDILAMSQEDQRDFYGKMAVTKGAECSVPIIKQKFAASCEQFFGVFVNERPRSPEFQKRLDSLGDPDGTSFVAKMCGCMVPALQKISTKDWVDSSMAQYNAYLERRRSGNNAIATPPGAFDVSGQ